jgi:hypothetical protein
VWRLRSGLCDHRRRSVGEKKRRSAAGVLSLKSAPTNNSRACIRNPPIKQLIYFLPTQTMSVPCVKCEGKGGIGVRIKNLAFPFPEYSPPFAMVNNDRPLVLALPVICTLSLPALLVTEDALRWARCKSAHRVAAKAVRAHLAPARKTPFTTSPLCVFVVAFWYLLVRLFT